ncbi:AAA family ATPase [Alsobacter sp. KACC 23698]|uniref:AAA family ATPase n=1 Tax=Alsobacter sp. KACC 23698 TaxID=3149229 RepID=A0AAU7JJZ7_9HYPH
MAAHFELGEAATARVAVPFLQPPRTQAAQRGHVLRGSPATISAAELVKKSFPPVQWIVPDLVPEGLTLLVGSPKTGKSWLALEIALAVASGSSCLAGLTCEQGQVLYLALEDNQRRLQRRICKLIGEGADGPGSLEFATEWHGGVAEIRKWLEEFSNARLVIIDVLQRFRPSTGKHSQYEADYQAIGDLQQLAGQYGVAIVVIHHTRKGEASDDPFEAVSGTQALAGAADTTLMLRRSSNGVTLYGRGRDIEELEKAVEFDRLTCRWAILGDAAEHHRSDQRTAVIDALRRSDHPMGPKDIAQATEMPEQNVRRLLGKMVSAGEIIKSARGQYTCAVVTGDPPWGAGHNGHNGHIGGGGAEELLNDRS